MAHPPITQSTFYMDIRFSDMDSQGHVNHEAMVGWIAHARISFIDGAIKAAEAKDIDYTLANLQVDFEKQINFPGEVNLAVHVKRVGSKSLTLRYILSKDKIRFAQSRSISVFLDTNTNKTVIIPDSLRKVLVI